MEIKKQMELIIILKNQAKIIESQKKCVFKLAAFL